MSSLFRVVGVIYGQETCGCPYCEGCRRVKIPVDAYIDADDEADALEKIEASPQIIGVGDDIVLHADELLDYLAVERVSDSLAEEMRMRALNQPTLFALA